MAYFDLADNPDGDGYSCATCHEGEYSLKNEALHAGDFGAHQQLPDDASYEDCLSCHASGLTDTQSEELVVDASDLREPMHTVHMESNNSHAPASCFTCHKVEGYGPDSPSGQFAEEGS